jgi:hypothetical protein
MIYVDSYSNHVPIGRFQIASTQEELSFHGLTQLLIGINDSLNQENFPQAFTQLRKFQNPRSQTPVICERLTAPSGLIATFSIRILFRQHSSWQGTISWLEGKQEECFRSVLELIVLLDNALGYAINPS